MTTILRQQEFQTLVDQHKKILYKVCNSYCRNREDREDLAQEIVVQLWRSFESFDERVRFSTWMYRIALNVAISAYRRESARTRYILSDEGQLLNAIDEKTHQSDEIQALHQSIAALDPLDKALVLLYLDGNSYQDGRRARYQRDQCCHQNQQNETENAAGIQRFRTSLKEISHVRSG
jgi:RNA polymerase sigma factor (sigma-70 family)